MGRSSLKFRTRVAPLRACFPAINDLAGVKSPVNRAHFLILLGAGAGMRKGYSIFFCRPLSRQFHLPSFSPPAIMCPYGA